MPGEKNPGIGRRGFFALVFWGNGVVGVRLPGKQRCRPGRGDRRKTKGAGIRGGWVTDAVSSGILPSRYCQKVGLGKNLGKKGGRKRQMKKRNDNLTNEETLKYA